MKKIFDNASNLVFVGYICAGLAALLFGSVSTVAKPVLSSVNPLLISSLVYLVSALVFAPSTIISYRKSVIDKKNYLLIFASAGFGGILAPVFYFSGLNLTTATDTSVLINGEILFTVLIAILFFKEKVNKIGYLAILLVIIGVSIITTNLSFSKEILSLDLGNLLVLCSTLFWAMDNNVSKLIASRVPIDRIVFTKSIIGGTILFVIIILSGISMDVKYEQISNILFLGIFGFGGSLFFFLQSLKIIGTVRTILIFSLTSVFGMIFASVFLHESIGGYQITATVIILSGIYLINSKYSHKKRD